MRKGLKSRVICGVLAAIVIFLLYWFMLPPLHPASPLFWTFIVLTLAVVLAAVSLPRLLTALAGLPDFTVRGKAGKPVAERRPMTRFTKVMLLILGGILVLALVLMLTGVPLFHSARYRDLLKTETGDFTADVAELSMNQIPVVDRDTAKQLGKRKLGEMADLVSQFEIAENYTQINLNNRPVRVTPLVYGDVIKWFNNHKQGLPAYIQVDMVTQDTKLVRLEQGMKYSPSELFLRNIGRYARFQYPTKMFDENFSFEVDDSGTPYWIVSTVTYRIGMWGGRDVEGAILINAVTGGHQYYPVDKIPTWVDQVYHADMLLEQMTYNGQFQSGFLERLYRSAGRAAAH